MKNKILMIKYDKQKIVFATHLYNLFSIFAILKIDIILQSTNSR